MKFTLQDCQHTVRHCTALKEKTQDGFVTGPCACVEKSQWATAWYAFQLLLLFNFSGRGTCVHKENGCKWVGISFIHVLLLKRNSHNWMQLMLESFDVLGSSSKVVDAETMYTEFKIAGPHSSLAKREAAGPKGKVGCIVAILQINPEWRGARRAKPNQTCGKKCPRESNCGHSPNQSHRAKTKPNMQNREIKILISITYNNVQKPMVKNLIFFWTIFLYSHSNKIAWFTKFFLPFDWQKLVFLLVKMKCIGKDLGWQGLNEVTHSARKTIVVSLEWSLVWQFCQILWVGNNRAQSKRKEIRKRMNFQSSMTFSETVAHLKTWIKAWK